MSEPEVAAIINGKADVGIDILDAIHRSVREDRILVTDGPGQIEDAARTLACDILWVVGGDGSLNEAARGLCARPDSDRPTLGIVPQGTANDYARGLDLLGCDFAAMIDTPSYLTPSAVDLITWGDRVVLNQVTIGAPAAITDTTPQAVKDAVGGAAYAIHGLQNPDQLEAFRAQVVGEDLDFEGEAFMVGFGVGPFGGGGIPVHPAADLRSGVIHAVIVTTTGVHRGQAAEFRVQIPDGTATNLDGESVAHQPPVVRVQRGALCVLLPETP